MDPIIAKIMLLSGPMPKPRAFRRRLEALPRPAIAQKLLDLEAERFRPTTVEILMHWRDKSQKGTTIT